MPPRHEQRRPVEQRAGSGYAAHAFHRAAVEIPDPDRHRKPAGGRDGPVVGEMAAGPGLGGRRKGKLERGDRTEPLAARHRSAGYPAPGGGRRSSRDGLPASCAFAGARDGVLLRLTPSHKHRSAIRPGRESRGSRCRSSSVTSPLPSATPARSATLPVERREAARFHTSSNSAVPSRWPLHGGKVERAGQASRARTGPWIGRSYPRGVWPVLFLYTVAISAAPEPPCPLSNASPYRTLSAGRAPGRNEHVPLPLFGSKKSGDPTQARIPPVALSSTTAAACLTPWVRIVCTVWRTSASIASWSGRSSGVCTGPDGARPAAASRWRSAAV